MAKRLEKDLYERLADKVNIHNLIETLDQTRNEIVENGTVLSDVKDQYEAVTLIRDLIVEEFKERNQ